MNINKIYAPTQQQPWILQMEAYDLVTYKKLFSCEEKFNNEYDIKLKMIALNTKFCLIYNLIEELSSLRYTDVYEFLKEKTFSCIRRDVLFDNNQYKIAYIIDLSNTHYLIIESIITPFKKNIECFFKYTIDQKYDGGIYNYKMNTLKLISNIKCIVPFFSTGINTINI